MGSMALARRAGRKPAPAATNARMTSAAAAEAKSVVLTPNNCHNPGGNTDVFVSIVNPHDPPHFLVYSTYFGGTQGEVAYDVKPDGAGNIYFTGYTLSPDL